MGPSNSGGVNTGTGAYLDPRFGRGMDAPAVVKEVSVSTSLKNLESVIASARDAFSSLRGRIEPVLEQSPETELSAKNGPGPATCIPLVNAIDDATHQIDSLVREIRNVHGKVRL